MKQTFLLGALLALGLPARPLLAQTAAALPTGVTQVTSVEGITEYRLANGLRVLLFPDQSKATATVNITYLVGSRLEGYGESGMAHLLEHMVFKGSPKHPNIPQELTEHGANPNGTTWLDRTNYFETFTSTNENLKWALDLESDRMVNSFIAKKDLESEFSVVRNEFESGENSPSRVLEERVLSSAYLWHNYGKSTIGSKEDIERVPIDNLKAFYQKYYQPDNAVLLVAGKFDPAKTLALIKQDFGPIPKPSRVLAATYTTEPTQDGERSVTLRRPGDTQALGAAYHVPAGSSPDYAATEALVEVLTNRPSGRLYKALIEGKKAASTWGYVAMLHDPGYAYFYADVRQGRSLDSARVAMLSALDAVGRTQPPTAEEVERAKTKLLKDIELLFQRSDDLGLTLSEYIATGDWRLVYLYRDNLRKVTAADVQRVAAAYLKPSNRTVGLFEPDNRPDRSAVPAAPDVAALVKNYKGEPAIAAGEAFDASPTNIDTRTKLGQEKNGLKYALLQKQNRGNAVNATLKIRYGSEATLSNKPELAGFTAVLLQRGTKTRTYAQIKDALDKAKAQVSFYGSGQTCNVSIQTDKTHLPGVLDIVLDCLRNPTFPAEEFEKFRQEYLAYLEAQLQEPQALAFNLATRLSEPYAPGHPLATLPYEQEIAAVKALKVEDVRAFYKQFYGAQNATVAVVGSFDEPALRQRLDKQLGTWKASSPYARIPQHIFSSTAQSQALQTNDKANAMFVTMMKYPLRDDSPDYAALYMANYILGDGFLNSRLATRIRQKEGVSYGVGSFMYADDNDEVGSFTSYAIYNPDNSTRLEQAYKEEVERLLKDGITADELKAAKSAALQNFQVQRSQDRNLASTWAQYLTKAEGRTFAYDAELDRRIAALTSEQVSAAAKKYLDYSKLTIVKAGDFARSAKPKASAP
ncbi:M16 family metallopeptidase [Hymenobacter bucti]|uniref:M16 family metallopeptidase n=1 Tax=Hymenobacter bucti TaxID=1844114 RepID=A0ABW4QW27_9BACT